MIHHTVQICLATGRGPGGRGAPSDGTGVIIDTFGQWRDPRSILCYSQQPSSVRSAMTSDCDPPGTPYADGSHSDGREAESRYAAARRLLHPGSRGSAWLAIGAVLLLANACDAPPESPVPEVVSEAPVPPDEGIQLSAGIDRLAFSPGDSMRVVLQLSNRLDAPRSLLFPSAQRFDLQLVDAGDEVVYRWSEDRSFAQVQEEVELPAGGNGPEWVEWLRLDLPEGTYLLRATIPIAGAHLETELPFEVAGEPLSPVDR